MTLLITGGNGFVGRALQRELEARAIDYRLYADDIINFIQLRHDLEGVTTIVHLASGEAHGRPYWLQGVDVDGVDVLIKALRYHQAGRVIVVSRLNASPHDLHPLLRAKGIVERRVVSSGLPYTIVRSATLFGRHDRFTNAIAATAAWSWPLYPLPGGGETSLQPLWVQDLARCLAAVIERDDLDNQTIEIGGAERIAYKQIVRLVLDAANLRRKLLNVHPLIARNVNRFTLWPLRRPPIHPFWHDRLLRAETTDLDSVFSHFGFRPARLMHHLTHLRRADLRRRLWQM